MRIDAACSASMSAIPRACAASAMTLSTEESPSGSCSGSGATARSFSERPPRPRTRTRLGFRRRFRPVVSVRSRCRPRHPNAAARQQFAAKARLECRLRDDDDDRLVAEQLPERLEPVLRRLRDGRDHTAVFDARRECFEPLRVLARQPSKSVRVEPDRGAVDVAETPLFCQEARQSSSVTQPRLTTTSPNRSPVLLPSSSAWSSWTGEM